MRIQIETLLIEINEELFTLSDQLARFYANKKPPTDSNDEKSQS